MFDFFNKKEVDDPSLLEQIIKDGVDYAAERFSSILMQDFLTTSLWFCNARAGWSTAR